jgi:hypothetical protein
MFFACNEFDAFTRQGAQLENFTSIALFKWTLLHDQTLSLCSELNAFHKGYLVHGFELVL